MAAGRSLGAAHVAAVAIGAIVGVGIFFTPAALARAVPTPQWVIGLWVIGAVASAAGALVFSDLSVRWPEAGGLYVFLREGGRGGHAGSFLYGWLQLLVVQPGAMAVIAIVLVDHLAYAVGIEIEPPFRGAGACAAIVIFTAANMLGLRTSGRIQIVMAALKIGALAALMFAGAVWGSAARVFVTPAAVHVEGDWSSWITLGLIPVLFTFGGAYHATFVAGAVRDPARSIPRGLIAGIAIVLVGYLGVNLAYLALLGHDRLAASTSPAADAIALALGPAAGKVVAAAIVVSAAGILNTISLGFPFVIHAMAKDGVFFSAAGALDPRTERPTRAVALQGALGCAAVLVGSSHVDVLLTGIAFADAIFQGAVAIVHLRVFGDRRIRAVIFLVVEFGLALGCLVRAPRESAYGAFMLAVGVLAWWRWKRR